MRKSGDEIKQCHSYWRRSKCGSRWQRRVDLVLYKYLLLQFCLLKFYKRALKVSKQAATQQPKPRRLLKTIKPLSTTLMCGWEISRDRPSNCAADQHKGQTKDSLIKMSFRTVALELLNVSHSSHLLQLIGIPQWNQTPVFFLFLIYNQIYILMTKASRIKWHKVTDLL